MRIYIESAKEFCKAVLAVSQCAAKKNMRPSLKCVNISVNPDEETLTLEATDSSILARWTKTVQLEGEKEQRKWCVEATDLVAMLTPISKSKLDATLVIEKNGGDPLNFICFDHSFYIKPVADKFPEIADPVYTNQNSVPISISYDVLKALVAVMDKAKGNAVKCAFLKDVDGSISIKPFSFEVYDKRGLATIVGLGTQCRI